MFQTLQSFRGLAALAVAAFHLSIGFGDPRYYGNPVFHAVTWRMDLGVDFFFVLSGFIIMMAHARDVGRPERLGRFVAKRFTRIYPAYWIYTGTFCLLVALGFGTAVTNPDTLPEWLTVVTLVRFENFLLPISPAWTLIHEVAFYLAFAVLILNRKAGFLVMAAWQIGCLVVFAFPHPHERTAFATYFAAFNVDFLIGIGAYWLHSRRLLHAPPLWLAGGVALFAATLAAESRGVPVPGTSLAYALAFGAIIYAAVSWEAGRRAGTRIPLLPFLGDASYSIYLTHIPLIGLFTKIAMRGVADPHLAYFLVLFATVAAGCCAYVIVERPLLGLRKRKGERDRRPAAAVVEGPVAALEPAGLAARLLR